MWCHHMLGNEDGIAGAKLGNAGGLQRLGEARKALEVRAREVHQTDRLSGGREIERPHVQVGDLLGRKQREAAMARDDTGEVVRQIVMRGDACAIADPDAGERLRARRN